MHSLAMHGLLCSIGDSSDRTASNNMKIKERKMLTSDHLGVILEQKRAYVQHICAFRRW